MWTRGELKDRARNTLSGNYWIIILGAFIMSVVSGNFGGTSSIKASIKDVTRELSDGIEKITYDREGIWAVCSKFFVNGWNSERLNDLYFKLQKNADDLSIAAIVGSAVIIVSLVFAVAGLMISIFLFNPLMAGGYRFFNRSLVMDTKINEFAFAFKGPYLNVVKIMFLKQLYTFLWSLLLFIPGIIKSYEYYLVPYIISDDPEIKASEAFRISRELMRGNKFKAWVLDLSFIGWYILSAMTCSILSIFFVTPYLYLTKAALYRRLRGFDDIQPNQGYNNSWNNNGNNSYDNSWKNNGNNRYDNSWNNNGNSSYDNSWNNNGNNSYDNGRNNNGSNGYDNSWNNNVSNSYDNGWDNNGNDGHYNNWDNQNNGSYNGGTWDSETNSYREDDR